MKVLLNCPFCGFPAQPCEGEHHEDVECSNSKCRLFFFWMSIDQWNTRASDEKVAKLMEFVKEMAALKWNESELLHHYSEDHCTGILAARRILNELGEA